MQRICGSLLTAILILVLQQAVSSSEPVVVDYNRDVRPILSDQCYRCHGPDAGERQTELRLDEQASAFALLESGLHAIVPGEPDDSEIIQRLLADDPDTRMPPPDSGKSLAKSQIRTLQRWVEDGAPWGTHWSFVAPQRPSFPKVQDRGWISNPIDLFVLARLEHARWKPSSTADRRTLVRRATLSLTGLPPTPQEVHAFLRDRTPDAYQQLVDRLLQSPRFGEHTARYWLDGARYGDTHGLHLDNERSIWRYRDWVIEACNDNMPFDQFTIEQLAGDLLPNATLDQKVATGFHRCNVTTSEGGAIAEEFLARYAIDRVETTSTVWMGLTTGCAACHDHKFDPISQQEFYQLFAYFYNLTEKAMDGNAVLPPPSLKAPTRLQQVRRAELLVDAKAIDRELDQLRAAAKRDRQWEAKLANEFGHASPPSDALLSLSFDEPNAWTETETETAKAKAKAKDVGDSAVGDSVVIDSATHNAGLNKRISGNLEIAPGKIDNAAHFDGKAFIDIPGVADFERTVPFSLGGWVKVHDNDAHAMLSKMDDEQQFRGFDVYLSGGKVFVHIIHAWPKNAIRVNTSLPIRKEKWQHVFATYDGSSKAAGVNIYVDGELQELELTHDTLSDSIQTNRPLRIGRRRESATFVGMLDEIQIFARQLSADEVGLLASSNPIAGILAQSVADRAADQDERLVDAYLQRDHAGGQRWFQQRSIVKKRIAKLESQFPSTLIMQERDEPREAFVLVRGQYDQLGERVSPQVPKAFPKSVRNSGSGSNSNRETRLSLARWLVQPNHPLTARVTVNRIWQQHFGVGLVRSSEDFGSQGEWPSHPQLLDYLATELIRSDWDIKAMHRLIVSSSTFRQASRLSEPARSDDPENRLLSHGPRFRLDGEVIRDVALAASGLLVGDVGGESVKPYQPGGLWHAVGYTASNTANFKRDAGDKLYRRGMYTFWKRTSPPPSMQILDAPSREVCTVRRPRTNTAAAALLLMNDTQFVEAARKLAERIVRACKEDALRMQHAYEVVLSRLPRPQETAVCMELLNDARSLYTREPALATQLLSHGDAAVAEDIESTELAAWTVIASMVLNLDETVNQN